MKKWVGRAAPWNRKDSEVWDARHNTQLASPSLPRCAEPLWFACGASEGRTNKHKVEHTMERGTIKWFDSEKGYGFIEPQDGSEDVFLHANNITGSTMGDDLREGQEVAYETEQTEKGLSALNASPVG
jgi:CspA family cold shock protein